MARRPRPRPNKPFDATTKTLVETNPKEWLDFLGLPATRFELVSADLSTVTTEADRIIHVFEPREYAVHQEFQAGSDRTFPDRCLRYNVLAKHRLQIPVRTVAVLLRPDADRLGNVTGSLDYKDDEGNTYLTFRYRVIRLWLIPAELILSGGLTTLPLALLGNLSNTDPFAVVSQMAARLESPAVASQTRRLLWTTAYILAGLTFTTEDIERLFGGIIDMKESVTYQKILAEGRNEGLSQGLSQGESLGRVREAQNMLLLVGEARLGGPDASALARLRAIDSVDRLEAMAKRILSVETWHELLA